MIVRAALSVGGGAAVVWLALSFTPGDLGAQYALPLSGQDVVLTLEPGEEHTLSLEQKTGDFLHLEVDQLSANVELVLRSNEETLWRTDQRPWAEHFEWAFALAENDRDVEVAVRSLGSRTGDARLRVVASRPATATDRDRFAAEELFDRSRTRRAAADVNDLHIDRARQAAQRFSALGLASREALAYKRVGVLLVLQGQALAALEPLETAVDVARRAGLAWEECYARLTRAEAVYVRSVAEALVEEREIRGGYLQPEARPCRLKNARLMAFDLAEQGAYHEAIEVLTEGIALADELQAEREIADLALNGSTSYLRLGEMDRALDLAARAHDRFQSEEREGLRLAALDNLAALFSRLGDFERALELREGLPEAMQQHGEPHDVVTARLNLAETLAALERLAEAKELNQAALGRANELENQRLIGSAHRALAALALAQDDYQSALTHAAAALEADESGGFDLLTDRILVARARAGLGEQGTLATFLVIADEAQESGDVASELEVRTRSAQLLWRQADAAGARVQLNRALEIVERVRSALSSDRLRSIYAAQQRVLYDLALEIELTTGAGGSASLARSFSILERARARSLRDFLDSAHGASRAALAPEFVAREERLHHQLDRAGARLAALRQDATAADRERIDARQVMRTIETKLDALAAEISDQNPRRGELLRPQPVGLEELRAVLGDAVLLSYHLTNDRGWLFVVDQESLQVHAIPGTEALIADVESLRFQLKRPSRFLGRFVGPAHSLWKSLVAPAAAQTAGRRLVISADGPLVQMPFESLLRQPASAGDGWQDLDYLGSSHSISYIPSAHLLWLLEEQQEQRAASEQGSALVAFADPSGGDGQAGTSPPTSARGSGSPLARRELPQSVRGSLPSARREVEMLTRLFETAGGVTALVGGDATEARARSSEVAAARYVHFATHAFVDADFAAQSALVLAPDAEHDGLLRLREVLRLDLVADLVTLSACQTWAGEAIVGEGTHSLARAFFFAGASSLLGSLWEVSDQATARLMERFYTTMASGGTKADALLAARRLLLSEPRTAHPYYWAAFQLHGVPR